MSFKIGRQHLFALFILLAATILAPIAASPLFAQAAAATGAVTGTLLDAKGNAIPNAAVLVRSETTNLSRRTTTDAQGRFSLSGLPLGRYMVEGSAPGFATTSRSGIQLAAGSPQDLTLTLVIGSVSQQVTVESENAHSIAAQLAPMDALLDARSARTEITPAFIQNFSSPVADYSELLQMAPGALSLNANGVGLGDGKLFFRGFNDGLYDITFDGIPFNDTNSPTHHSWAFFPSQWVGAVDFDRSPGSASTVGPTPFGGSINLLSKEMPTEQSIRGGVSYGSFNTMLIDGSYDSGNFGGRSRRSNVLIDVHRMTSDGYQTFNYQQRVGGSLKYQLKFSDKTVLTGFSGVIALDTNTPNTKGPTRAQVAQFGKNYLMQNTDPTLATYKDYNYYHVPTDFEYVGFKTEFGHGWRLDTKPYTYSYYNAQYYATDPKTGNINPTNCNPKGKVRPCATDKNNSYRKYGEITSLSQVSRFGVFRAGLWYEWATTDRYQIPSDPISKVDDVLPNFHEKFWTNSYQPFAEYQYQATPKLSLTGGIKLARYTQDLKQYADNGKTIGTPPNGAPFITRSGAYTSWLPSVDANYRLKTNWSVYGQFSTGSVIPPSNVFDVSGTVTLLPKPTGAKTYQAGSVVKLRRATLDLDVYYTHFANSYASSPDPNNPSGTQYTATGDSVSKGFEGSTNLYLVHGLSLFASGTAGTAKYVSKTLDGKSLANYGLWVASAPSNTQSLGLTYQQRSLDLGIFNKRIGPQWNDNTAADGTTLNQVIPINSFNITNAFINYTVLNGSLFDQTKLRLSFNNLFDQKNIVGVNQKATGTAVVPGPSDTLTLLPGRSIMLSVTFGLAPKR